MNTPQLTCSGTRRRRRLIGLIGFGVLVATLVVVVRSRLEAPVTVGAAANPTGSRPSSTMPSSTMPPSGGPLPIADWLSGKQTPPERIAIAVDFQIAPDGFAWVDALPYFERHYDEQHGLTIYTRRHSTDPDDRPIAVLYPNAAPAAVGSTYSEALAHDIHATGTVPPATVPSGQPASRGSTPSTLP